MCVDQEGRRGKSIDLFREVSQTVPLAAVTTNCEKSAEAIVGRKKKKKVTEGLNNVTVQTNVCTCVYPTSGCRRNVNEP